MSDHISGPRALADPIADITDVYAFPSPEQAGSPRARREHAADGQALRPVLGRTAVPLQAATAQPAVANGQGWRFVPADEEYVLDCVFSTPDPAADEPVQEGTCTSPTGESVSFRVNDPQGGSGAGMRVFAGTRWDPFIMDARAALTTLATHELAFTDPGSIFLDGKNVLSLVDRAGRGAAGRRDLVGVVAETLTRGNAQRPDRTRRPARGEEHDARAEGVRPGEPGPGDPRPVQHGGRLPPRRHLRRCLPRASERQPRLLGRPGRQGGLADRTRTATTR